MPIGAVPGVTDEDPSPQRIAARSDTPEPRWAQPRSSIEHTIAQSSVLSNPRTVGDHYARTLGKQFMTTLTTRGEGSPPRDFPPARVNIPADRLYDPAVVACQECGRDGTKSVHRGSKTVTAAPDNRVPHEVPADVRFGLWSCCRSVQPGAVGCVTEKCHWNFTQQCSQCGLWVDAAQVNLCLRPLVRWTAAGMQNEVCIYHPDEPHEFSTGGVKWRCCGGVGYQRTRYGYAENSQINPTVSGYSVGAPPNRLTAEQRERWGCVRGKHKPSRPGSSMVCPECGYSNVPAASGACPECGCKGVGRCSRCGSRDPHELCTFHPGVWCPSRRVRRIAEPQLPIPVSVDALRVLWLEARPLRELHSAAAFALPDTGGAPVLLPKCCSVQIVQLLRLRLRNDPKAIKVWARDALEAHVRLNGSASNKKSLKASDCAPLSVSRRDGKELHVTLCFRDQCGKCGEVCPKGHEASFQMRHLRDDCPNAQVSKDCPLECGARFVGRRCILADWDCSHPPVCPNRPVQCQYKCGTTMSHREMEEHLSTCPNRPVTCKMCYKKLQFRELTEHAPKCPRRMITCSLCYAECCAADMDEHVCPECKDCGAITTNPPHCPFHPLCPKEMVECSKKCGAWITRDSISEHMLVCPEELVECALGCGFATTRRLAGEHMRECMAPCSVCGEQVHRSILKEHEANCGVHEQIIRSCKPLVVGKSPPPPPPKPRQVYKPLGQGPDRALYHPYPVCNGYCRKRWKIAHSKRPGRHVERNSWMMCQPVSIHWQAPDKKQIQHMRDDGIRLRPQNEKNPLKSPSASRPSSPQRKSRPPSRASLGLYSPKVSKALSTKMRATARARRKSAPTVNTTSPKGKRSTAAASGRRSATPTCGTRKVKPKAKSNSKSKSKPKRAGTPKANRGGTPSKSRAAAQSRAATPIIDNTMCGFDY